MGSFAEFQIYSYQSPDSLKKKCMNNMHIEMAGKSRT